MKKLLVLIFAVSVLLTSCRQNADDENKPTSIPPAKSTPVPTMATDVNTNQPNPVVSYYTDFEKGSDGYYASFADYPQDRENDYALSGDIGSIPDIGSMGYMLSGTNQNNDLLMYISKGFEVLPSTNYIISVSFDIVGNVPKGTYSIGKPQGENVFIKTGASNVPIAAIIDNEDMLRVNWDIGNNELSGTEGNTLETVEKHQSNDETFELKHILSSYQVKSSEDGRLYAMIGVDSGVNTTTTVYIDNVTVEITEQ